jgi:hypothetical protein
MKTHFMPARKENGPGFDSAYRQWTINPGPSSYRVIFLFVASIVRRRPLLFD